MCFVDVWGKTRNGFFTIVQVEFLPEYRVYHMDMYKSFFFWIFVKMASTFIWDTLQSYIQTFYSPINQFIFHMRHPVVVRPYISTFLYGTPCTSTCRNFRVNQSTHMRHPVVVHPDISRLINHSTASQKWNNNRSKLPNFIFGMIIMTMIAHSAVSLS